MATLFLTLVAGDAAVQSDGRMVGRIDGYHFVTDELTLALISNQLLVGHGVGVLHSASCSLFCKFESDFHLVFHLRS